VKRKEKAAGERILRRAEGRFLTTKGTKYTKGEAGWVGGGEKRKEDF
jgi:hypothetical protein